MKRGERILILVAAVILAVAGFNVVVASPSLDVIRASQTAHYEIVVTASAATPSASGITG